MYVTLVATVDQADKHTHTYTDRCSTGTVTDCPLVQNKKMKQLQQQMIMTGNSCTMTDDGNVLSFDGCQCD